MVFLDNLEDGSHKCLQNIGEYLKSSSFYDVTLHTPLGVRCPVFQDCAIGLTFQSQISSKFVNFFNAHSTLLDKTTMLSQHFGQQTPSDGAQYP
jgi:hypothetical protein